MSSLPTPLVSTEWLAGNLDDPRIVVIDASFHLPAAGRDAAAEHHERRVPGAIFFDIDRIADRSSPLPHTVPPVETFAAEVSALGIGNDALVVAYDAYGLMSAGRAWWMFRLFGHDAVAVLDGGLPKWLAEDRPVHSGPATGRPLADFKAHLRSGLLAGRDEIAAGLEGGLVDARSRGRFEGAEPEVRPGLRSGHIPGSRSLPLADLVAPDTKAVKPAAELRALFEAAGIDPAGPVTTTCGSGVTACGLALGLALLGNEQVRVYDGSWTEWGQADGPPLETGPARPL